MVSNYFFMFIPKFGGFMIQMDLRIFFRWVGLEPPTSRVFLNSGLSGVRKPQFPTCIIWPLTLDHPGPSRRRKGGSMIYVEKGGAPNLKRPLPKKNNESRPGGPARSPKKKSEKVGMGFDSSFCWISSNVLIRFQIWGWKNYPVIRIPIKEPIGIVPSRRL